jgi:hypothetical protein
MRAGNRNQALQFLSVLRQCTSCRRLWPAAEIGAIALGREQSSLARENLPMDFTLDKVQVWSAEIPDRAGGAAGILGPLAEAGANLEFILSRRLSHRPGTGELFVAPITGPQQTRAAHATGLHHATDMELLRIRGTDRPGVGHHLAATLAQAGLNLRSLTMAAIDGRFVAYVACEKLDTAKAVQALAALKV